MTSVHSRPYRSADFDAAMAIFDGNTPPFFDPTERAEFSSFLQNLDAATPYLVLEREGEVIGCGGLWVEVEARRAKLSWGMISRALHGQGLGTVLTKARLDMAREDPRVDQVALETSQHTHGFYEKLGFRTVQVIPNGFGPGLNEWDMVLDFEKV